MKPSAAIRLAALIPLVHILSPVTAQAGSHGREDGPKDWSLKPLIVPEPSSAEHQAKTPAAPATSEPASPPSTAYCHWDSSQPRINPQIRPTPSPLPTNPVEQPVRPIRDIAIAADPSSRSQMVAELSPFMSDPFGSGFRSELASDLERLNEATRSRDSSARSPIAISRASEQAARISSNPGSKLAPQDRRLLESVQNRLSSLQGTTPDLAMSELMRGANKPIPLVSVYDESIPGPIVDRAALFLSLSPTEQAALASQIKRAETVPNVQLQFIQGLLPRDWNASSRIRSESNSCAGFIGITLRDQLRSARLQVADLEILHEYVRTGSASALDSVGKAKALALKSLGAQLKAVQVQLGEPLMPGDLLIHRHSGEDDGEAWIVHEYDVFYKSARVVNPFGFGIPSGASGAGMGRLKTFNLLEDSQSVSEFNADLSPARPKQGVMALRLRGESLAEDCSSAIRAIREFAAQQPASTAAVGRQPASAPQQSSPPVKGSAL